MENIMENVKENLHDRNQVYLSGSIEGEFVYSHKVKDECFYIGKVSVPRLSGTEDILPVLVSESFYDSDSFQIGNYVQITGQLRSYNLHLGDNKSRLLISVIARDISVFADMPEDFCANQILVDGYICNPPIYRKKASGKSITDLFLAVNRYYGRTSYIPCICWDNNALFAKNLTPGDRIKLYGRLQSREFPKKISEFETEKRVAYEVSAFTVEQIFE